MFKSRIRIVLLASLMLLPIAAHAQRNDDRKGGVPGRFDYYALVLSWSPTYCLEVARGKRDPQCDRRDGRRFAFVLHGLWPQYERGYPDFCRTRDKPFVPQRTIDRMRDIMPSAGLTIHEYRKHGTCTGLSPDGYYELSRRLFEKIKIPPRFRDPTSHQTIPMRQVIDEFMAANPKLKPDMIAVSCGRPGNRIKDVRICFSREGEFRTCGGNERQRRMCGAPRVYIPPVRVGRPIPPSGRSGGGQGPQSDGRSL